MKLPELQEWITHPVVAAAAGSILGLKAIPGASLPQKIVNGALSFLLASFGGPAIVSLAHVSSPNVAGGIIFGVGATGLVVFDGLIEAIKRTDLGGRLIEWAASWLPKRPGGQ